MDNIVIIGSSGHAKVVIDIVEQAGKYRIAGLLDRFRAVGEQTLGYAVLGGEDDLDALTELHDLKAVIVAIGDNFVRAQMVAYVEAHCPTLPFATAIHPSAQMGRDVAVGGGTVVMSGVSVNPACSIGRHCVLNTHASLDHDSHLHNFASLAPGVHTGGHCHIGAYAAVGIGAVLIHGINIGEHAVIGAGSTVTHDIDAYVVAYGTPARAVRLKTAGDTYL